MVGHSIFSFYLRNASNSHLENHVSVTNSLSLSFPYCSQSWQGFQWLQLAKKICLLHTEADVFRAISVLVGCLPTVFSYFDFGLKNSSFRLPYQRPSSSADCAGDLFNGSNGSASLVDCIRKTIFWLGGGDLLFPVNYGFVVAIHIRIHNHFSGYFLSLS